MAKTYFNPATGRQTTIAPSSSSTIPSSSTNTLQKTITDPNTGKQSLNPNYSSPTQTVQQSGGTSQLLANQGSAVIKVQRADGGYDYYANPEVMERENLAPGATPQKTLVTVAEAAQTKPTVRISTVSSSGSSRVLSRAELSGEVAAAQAGEATNAYKKFEQPQTVKSFQSAQQTQTQPRQQQVGTIVRDPFFSWEGQKQRITNAALVTAEAATSPFFATYDYAKEKITGKKQQEYKITANTGNKILDRSAEYLANNPLTSAGIITGGVYAARGVTGLVASRTAAQTAATGAAAQTAASDAALTQVAQQSAKATTKSVATNFAKGAGSFTVDLAKTGTVGLATYKGVQTGADVFTSSENRDIIFDKDFKQAVASGYRAEDTSVSKQPWYKQLANDIPVVSIWTGDKAAFKQGAKEFYLNQGYSEEQANKAAAVAARERTVRSASLGASFLTTSASTEIIGSKYVTGAFKDLGVKGVSLEQAKSGLKIFKTAGFQIGKAGIIEGSVQQTLQDISKERGFQSKNTAIAAAAGGVSAGVIGGGIAAFAVKQQKARQAALQGFSYFTDPYEYPGDKIADAYRFTMEKTFKKNFPQPQAFYNRLDGVPTITFTPSAVPVSSNTPIDIKTPTTINIPSIEIPTKDNVGVFVFQPNPKTPVRPNVPVMPNIPVNPKVPIQPEVPIQPNVPILTDTPINIPVVTPQMRIPPPFLPSVSLGGAVGRSGTQGKKYVNELQAAFSLFGVANTTAPLKKAKKSKVPPQFERLQENLAKQGYKVKITKKKGKK